MTKTNDASAINAPLLTTIFTPVLASSDEDRMSRRKMVKRRVSQPVTTEENSVNQYIASSDLDLSSIMART